MSDHFPAKERMCHHAWFEKSCRELVTSGACERWHDVTMRDPKTGTVMSRWDCIDNHMFLLQLKQIEKTDQVGAAVESFRNEVSERQPLLPMMTDEPKRIGGHG